MARVLVSEATPRPLAILGGTFDPVHNAHLRVAWDAADALDADVRLMPAHVPPHRATPLADAAHRVALLRVALAGQSRLSIDERELRRSQPSYTVDTLRELRLELGAQHPLILLVGADAFAGLPTWREWRALFDFAHVVVLTRPGHGGTLPAELAEETAPRRVTAAAALRRAPCGRVFDLPVTPLEISASLVRRLLAEGREPRWLVPEAFLADPALLAPYRPAARAGRA